MFWGYVGLLAAFVAEVMVRLPLILSVESSRLFADANHSAAIGFVVAIFISFIIMAAGEFAFRAYRKKWFG
jgi:ABC-type polysaccharide/polyol phosphate export permease|tara:strand:- start:211 stop:423 length:213 start_codon:yes stop_codon:yes gene_type:complete